MINRYGICIFFLVFFLTCGYAQTEKPLLLFYGAKTDSTDTEAVNLSQELFFTQLAATDFFSITDKRPEIYTGENDQADYIFYSEIRENSGSWLCTLYLLQLNPSKEFTNTKQYESFYKILLESKTALMSLLHNIQGSNLVDETKLPSVSGARITSIESLAGTWKGEPYVDKIMILKGGRGFVIYKNGATMNITVSLTGPIITAQQISKPNASFFPEIAREEALLVAQNAEPIKWQFSVNSDGSVLFGERASLGTISSVVWTRQ